jgi:hypothetical protein
MRSTESEKSDRKKAAIFTAVIHGIGALLMFFLVAFSIQDPPPGDMYVEIGMADYGFDEKAGGNKETEKPSENVEKENEKETTPTKPTPTPTPNDKVTQTESTVSVPKGNKTDKPKTETKPEEQKVSDALSNILNQMNQSGGGGSQGTQTGTGNEGSKDGKVGGTGVLGSDGVGYDLGGRGLASGPSALGSATRNGVIVVEIKVNQDGVVTSAKTHDTKVVYLNGVGYSTNIPDQDQKDIAEKSAKTAKFHKLESGQPVQVGYMVFFFKVR